MSDQQTTQISIDSINEQIVIAAALGDPKKAALLTSAITINLFIDPEHQSIWSAICQALHKQLTITPEALVQISGGKIDKDYVNQLLQLYPTPTSNLEHHIATLRWDHAKAEAVRGPLTSLVRGFQDQTMTQARLRGLAQSLVSSLSTHVDRSFMSDPGALARSTVEMLRDRGTKQVYPFGIPELDKHPDGTWRLIPGAAPGKTTVITGSSGSGKSVITARIALQMARQKRRILYGAWEMGADETMALLCMMALGWSRYDVSTGNLSAEKLIELEQMAQRIGDYIRFFDPPFDRTDSRASNDDALDTIEANMMDSGCDVSIFDLWERAIPDGDPGPERRALFRQQSIAKRTQMHQILVAQQKLKELEKRADKRPTRDTILGSSAWVDISDTIVGIHRPALWKSIEDNSLEAICLKQRYGKWPFAVAFDWDGDKATLTNGRDIPYDTAVGKANDWLST